jgi:hypothetical protein
MKKRSAVSDQRSAKPKSGVCRYCGCTDGRACLPPCWWIDKAHTICSAGTCLLKYCEDLRGCLGLRLTNADIGNLVTALARAVADLNCLIECNLPPSRKNWEPGDKANFEEWDGERKIYRALRHRLARIEARS